LNSPGRQVFRLTEIVDRCGGELLGDPDIVIHQIATLETAGAGQISFFANQRYRQQLERTRAAAVILAAEFADATACSRARTAVFLPAPVRRLRRTSRCDIFVTFEFVNRFG
jgi:UDP-3-O-[3-hydroxymyristoyl] glucosamine N-acyltransferase